MTWLPRVNRDCLLNQAEGAIGASPLQRNDAQQMKGVWMPGVDLKYLFINEFRLIEASRLMLFHAPGQEISRHSTSPVIPVLIS